MANLKRRVQKMEKANGVGLPIQIIKLKFVSPEGPERLAPEEEAALEAYVDKEVASAQEGGMVMVMWTREKAQELLALSGENAQRPTEGPQAER
jgi:hypothetical protein